MNREKITIKIKEQFKKETIKNKDIELLYLTLSGAHLYGLDTPNSDIDVKGLYLTSVIDVKKTSPDFLNFSTNKNNSKNSKEDIDIELYSINKFYKMLEVGDTNAYDLLFSIFSNHNILFFNKKMNYFKDNYKIFLTSNSKAFMGYVVQQTKKYGVKGERFNSLKNTIKLIEEFKINNNLNEESKVEELIKYVKENKLENKYLNIKELTEKNEVQKYSTYLEVLNKYYEKTQSIEYLQNKLNERLKSYGERSKKASSGIDFKSLSHAYRIVMEFEELLKFNFIKFPLKNKEEILKIKLGDLSDFNDNYEEILNFLDKKVLEIEKEIEITNLQPKLDVNLFNKLLIELIVYNQTHSKTKKEQKKIRKSRNNI
jgi:predicted nucleotidyltransferase